MASENPLPAPGGIVYCLGAWPGARPSRQRPRCNLLGALRFARCCGREWRGRAGGGAGAPPRDGPLGAAGGPGACRRRRSPPPRPETRPEEGLSAAGSGPRLPSLPHPHPPRPKRKEGGDAERGHPSAWRECARPRRPRPQRGGRGAGAARACGGGSVCGPVFGQLSTLGEKNICLKVQKRGAGGKELKKKTVKHRLERMFAK